MLMNAIYNWLFPATWWSFGVYWAVSALWVRKAKVMESPIPRITHLLLTTFAILVLTFHNYFPRRVDWQLWPQNKFTFWSGATVMLAGLVFAVWARIHLGRFWSGSITLKEGHRLIRNGPYQFVRNPIYTGILIGVLGTAIALGRISGLVALTIFFAVFHWKICREERLLAAEFGDEFAAYCREVPALLPFKINSANERGDANF
jgi:protein-S-isoprenylcysteine O-methyltransferase Ste14